MTVTLPRPSREAQSSGRGPGAAGPGLGSHGTLMHSPGWATRNPPSGTWTERGSRRVSEGKKGGERVPLGRAHSPEGTGEGGSPK